MTLTLSLLILSVIVNFLIFSLLMISKEEADELRQVCEQINKRNGDLLEKVKKYKRNDYRYPKGHPKAGQFCKKEHLLSSGK